MLVVLWMFVRWGCEAWKGRQKRRVKEVKEVGGQELLGKMLEGKKRTLGNETIWLNETEMIHGGLGYKLHKT